MPLLVGVVPAGDDDGAGDFGAVDDVAFGAFFTGALLIETLFSLDGLGLLSFESVVRRDYPVVLGSLYLFTLIGLVVKLVSDLLYVAVDPRVQFGAVGN